MNIKKIFRTVFYFILVFTVSCASVPSATPTVVRIPTSTLAPTSIPPTLTPTSTSTQLPTITPLPTATHLPTLTPLPTLAPDKAEALIEELLNTNVGCRLPCWWGITPGKTKWEEAERNMRTIATKIESADFKRFTTYSLYFSNTKTKNNWPHNYRVDENGVIDLISVDTPKTENFSISELLSTYGKPDDISFFTYATLEPYFTRIFILYSQQGIIAWYGYRATTIGNNRANTCFPDTSSGPHLYLWSTDRKISLQEASLEGIGMYGVEISNIRDETGISIDDFYLKFKSPSTSNCIESIAH